MNTGRRELLKMLGGTAATAAMPVMADHHKKKPLSLNYVLSSALYGDLPLADVLPEVEKSGSVGIDIWCKVHATHREQIDEMGEDKFGELLEETNTKLTAITRYPLGPMGLQKEMPFAKKFGAKILVCGTAKPSEPEGEEAKKAVKNFIEKMKPHADAAAEHGLVIAVENHANQLLQHPDAVKYFAEFNHHPGLGVSFAPHHMQTYGDEKVAEMIRVLGKDNIPFIYFQEHGIGSKKTVAKEIELEQLPGFGTLDYVQVLKALRDIEFDGVAEIFMHPTPRGVPMLPTAGEITAAVNKSRAYLANCLKEVNA